MNTIKRFTPIKFKDIYVDEQGQEQVKDITLLFRLGPKAAYNYKKISGKSLDTLGKEGFDVEEIVQLLYAGCVDMNKDLTIDKMWDLVDNFELDELAELINDIFPQNETNNDEVEQVEEVPNE